MLIFGETKVAKEEFYDAKQPIKIWDVDVNNSHLKISGNKEKF